MIKFQASAARIVVLSGLLSAAIAQAAQPDIQYPNRPIRIVVPYSGGSSDVAARLLAPRLSDAL